MMKEFVRILGLLFTFESQSLELTGLEFWSLHGPKLVVRFGIKGLGAIGALIARNVLF